MILRSTPEIQMFSLDRMRGLAVYSRDRRDVTALATCKQINRKVNFYITSNGKMMKNYPHLFKFPDFFTILHLFRRKNISFCPATMILIIIAAIFHKLVKKTRVWVGWWAMFCDHLDVKEMSVPCFLSVNNDKTKIKIHIPTGIIKL